jgi:hypothetical protein
MKSLIYQWFSKKKEVKLTDNSEYLKIKIIDDTAQTISASLGITDKRKQFLIDLVKTEMKEHENIVEIMVNISQHVTHQNELGFAIYVLAQHLEKECQNPIVRIMGIIGKKFDGED